MRTEALLKALVSAERTGVGFLGTPVDALKAPPEQELVAVLGRKDKVLLSFSRAGYDYFFAALSDVRKKMPPLLQKYMVEAVNLRREAHAWVVMPKHPPALVAGRVILHSQVVHDLSAWLWGRVGRQGIATRNTLEKKFFPERFVVQPTTTPAPRPTPLPQPASQEKLSPDELRKLGLIRLEKLFDVVKIRPHNLPSIADFSALTADGKDAEEMFQGSALMDGIPTVWVLEDAQGFSAALVGPSYAQNYECEVRRSSSMFRVYGLTYSQLRVVKDLRLVLHRSGAVFGDGLAAIVSRHDEIIGSILSLTRLAQLLGVSPKKK